MATSAASHGPSTAPRRPAIPRIRFALDTLSRATKRRIATTASAARTSRQEGSLAPRRAGRRATGISAVRFDVFSCSRPRALARASGGGFGGLPGGGFGGLLGGASGGAGGGFLGGGTAGSAGGGAASSGGGAIGTPPGG